MWPACSFLSRKWRPIFYSAPGRRTGSWKQTKNKINMKSSFEYAGAVLPLSAVAGRTLVPMLILLVCSFTSIAQSNNSDGTYEFRLKDVLKDIEQHYGVTVRADEKLVAGKNLKYARWRY